jgi:hypothetical protein
VDQCWFNGFFDGFVPLAYVPREHLQMNQYLNFKNSFPWSNTTHCRHLVILFVTWSQLWDKQRHSSPPPDVFLHMYLTVICWRSPMSSQGLSVKSIWVVTRQSWVITGVIKVPSHESLGSSKWLHHWSSGSLKCHHHGSSESYKVPKRLSIKFQFLGSGQIVSNQNLLLVTDQNSGTHNQN